MSAAPVALLIAPTPAPSAPAGVTPRDGTTATFAQVLASAFQHQDDLTTGPTAESSAPGAEPPDGGGAATGEAEQAAASTMIGLLAGVVPSKRPDNGGTWVGAATATNRTATPLTTPAGVSTAPDAAGPPPVVGLVVTTVPAGLHGASAAAHGEAPTGEGAGASRSAGDPTAGRTSGAGPQPAQTPGATPPGAGMAGAASGSTAAPAPTQDPTAPTGPSLHAHKPAPGVEAASLGDGSGSGIRGEGAPVGQAGASGAAATAPLSHDRPTRISVPERPVPVDPGTGAGPDGTNAASPTPGSPSAAPAVSVPGNSAQGHPANGVPANPGSPGAGAATVAGTTTAAHDHVRMPSTSWHQAADPAPGFDPADLGMAPRFDLGSAPNPVAARPAELVGSPLAVPQMLAEALRTSRNGTQRLVIRLDPPELGSLTIDMVARGDDVRIVVRAEQADTANALHQRRSELTQVLAKSGFDLSGFDVSAGQHHQRGTERNRASMTGPSATEPVDPEAAPTTPGALFL